MISPTDSSVAFSPDLPRILRAQGWQRVELLDAVDSTNVHAASNPQPWSLVAAHDQRAGRGRLARTWEVPPGRSVALSVTVPLPTEAGAWGWVPLFVGRAVLTALERLAPTGKFALKWPNDLLVTDPASGEPRKVAGVLCQVVGRQQPSVVVGVGVNVTQEPDELPVPTAASLRTVGLTVSRDELLVGLGETLHDLAQQWDDPASRSRLRDEVRERCATIGAPVTVHTPDGRAVHTEAVGIDDDGRLVTRSPGRRPGEAPRVVAYSVADVEHVRPAKEKTARG